MPPTLSLTVVLAARCRSKLGTSCWLSSAIKEFQTISWNVTMTKCNRVMLALLAIYICRYLHIYAIWCAKNFFSTPGVLRLCSEHEIVTTVTAALLCSCRPAHTTPIIYICRQLPRCSIYSPLAGTVLSLSTLSEVVSTRRSCAPPSTRTPPSPRPGTPPSCSSCRAREISDSSAVKLLSVSDKMDSNLPKMACSLHREVQH